MPIAEEESEVVAPRSEPGPSDCPSVALHGPLEVPISIVAGTAAAVGLFVFVALTQLLGEVERPQNVLTEQLVQINAPEVEEFPEEEVAPPEPEEVPELEPPDDAPKLTLDQLSLALNPGSGGAIVGDFALPAVASNLSQLIDEQDFVDFSALDRVPRPIGVSGLKFPRYLRKQRANGTIVLLIKLDSAGRVLEASVESSDLPRFDEVVRAQVESWRFTPPTQEGRPVNAKARLPIPIRVG